MKLFDVAILLLAAAVAAQQQTVTIGTEMLFDDDTARVVCEPVDCQTLYITKVSAALLPCFRGVKGSSL